MTAFRKKVIYVYDALCPWCYAFTPVVEALYREYGTRFDFEVLSGGMIRGDHVRVVGGEEEAARLRSSYREIEARTGARFGEAFYEGIRRGGRRLDSEPPAIALAAFRTLGSARSEVAFAHALVRAIFWEGGDPGEAEFYRGIARTLELDGDALLAEMTKEETRDRALYDFALARQLGADAFPRLYLQSAEDYLHLISKGYSDLERVRGILHAIEKDSG